MMFCFSSPSIYLSMALSLLLYILSFSVLMLNSRILAAKRNMHLCAIRCAIISLSLHSSLSFLYSSGILLPILSLTLALLRYFLLICYFLLLFFYTVERVHLQHLTRVAELERSIPHNRSAQLLIDDLVRLSVNQFSDIRK